jgi:luciferase family oxidoreductase group 1
MDGVPLLGEAMDGGPGRPASTLPRRTPSVSSDAGEPTRPRGYPYRDARPRSPDPEFPLTLPLSILDLVPASGAEGGSDAIRRIADLARLADRLGYARYWIAEHHNMRSLACPAPEVLIAHVAAVTERIRVGSGGVMLPNHVPLQVAERYRTLEALHPGRIDLGIGRAPGTDPLTSRALRSFDAERFPEMLQEMTGLAAGTLPEEHPFHKVRAVPDDVRLPPIWILGSSGSSAEYAGGLGMGYGFAAHFSLTSPVAPMLAYRRAFQPSATFPEPHAVLALSVVCAETEERARWLSGPLELVRVRLHRGERRRMPPPEEAAAHEWTPEERSIAERYRAMHIAGDPDGVRAQIEARAAETQADEVMVFTSVYDPVDRLRSYELLAEAFALPGA